MNNNINEILKEALNKLQTAQLEQIENIKVEYLGKKGKITEILKTLSSLTIEEKKAIGSQVNDAKNKLTEAMESKRKEIANKILEASKK